MKTYPINTLREIAAIPAEERARCLRDLPTLIEHFLATEAEGKVVTSATWSPDEGEPGTVDIYRNGVKVT